MLTAFGQLDAIQNTKTATATARTTSTMKTTTTSNQVKSVLSAIDIMCRNRSEQFRDMVCAFSNRRPNRLSRDGDLQGLLQLSIQQRTITRHAGCDWTGRLLENDIWESRTLHLQSGQPSGRWTRVLHHAQIWCLHTKRTPTLAWPMEMKISLDGIHGCLFTPGACES